MELPLSAISAGLGLAKTGFGVYQNIRGNNILNNAERPEYTVPEEVYSNLTEAQRMALDGLPSEQKMEYLRNIDRSTSTGLSASASRKGGLANVDNILKSQTDAYSSLMTQDSVARMQNKQAVMAQRQNLANYKDKAFEVNEMQPFQAEVAEGQALVGSGLQNIFGGLTDMGSAAMSAINSNQMDKMYGLNGEAPAQSSSVNQTSITTPQSANNLTQAYQGQGAVNYGNTNPMSNIMQQLQGLNPNQLQSLMQALAR